MTDHASRTVPTAAEGSARTARTAGMRRRLGSLVLYAVGFALLLTSGALIVAASLAKLDEGALGLLRVSWWLSGGAIVVAVAAVLLSGRPER
jgi:hypothetical protein